MADGDTGIKWWARNVLVPLIGGGGLVTILVAYLNRAPSSAPPPTPDNKPAATDTGHISAAAPTTSTEDHPPPPPKENPRVKVETFASHWLAAWSEGRTDEVVSAASEPFRFHHREVFATRAQLRGRYEEDVAAHRVNLKFDLMKVQTAREFEDAGRAGAMDLYNLSPGDFVVFAEDPDRPGMGKGIYVFIRRKGDSFEVAAVDFQ